eukprot:IDg6077t1
MVRTAILKISENFSCGLLDLIPYEIDCPLRFSKYTERQKGRNTKALRSDGGGEYTSNEYQAYLEQNGIVQQLTV